jgi:putative component of membrane protein insertase Oxa1/YidC/SpoIIIJ protein YidD
MLVEVMAKKRSGAPSRPVGPESSAVVTGHTILPVLGRAYDTSRRRSRTPWWSAIAVSLIRLYQRRFSGAMSREGFRCNHYPSCSAYAVLAYQTLGFVAATRASLNRIRDCGRPGSRPFVDLP